MPPATQHAVLTVEGRGIQIYSCAKTGSSTQWVLVAPAARLFDKDGIEVGTHGDGPVWYLQDGSSVMGKAIARSVPDASSVPWLLLQAARAEGAGRLAGVEYVRRSATKGGIPADSGCDATHLGDIGRVPYTATYTFYSSKAQPTQ